MSTNIYRFLVFSILSLLIVQCSNDQPRIGFLMDNLIQDRWEKDKALFEEKVKELGGEVVVEIAEGEAVKQLVQAEKLIAEDVDVLVVVPVDLNAAAKIVELAHNNNVQVISYDRLIKNCELDFYVSFDNVEVGSLQADYLTKICPTGNYALIEGPVSDNNSFLLKLGQMNVLQPLIEKGDIKIIYDQFVEEWHEDDGYNYMSDCIKKSGDKIDAVIAANDALASGAVKAIKENGLEGKIFVTGMDAEVDACQRILNGDQVMTVYKPIEAIASVAANIAVQMAEQGSINTYSMTVNNGKKLVPSVLLPAMVVNRENIKMTVVADGYLEENNIYQ